jgi:hypothetical protein
MQLLKKTGLTAAAILFAILLAGWLFIKVAAARNATVYAQQWNERGTCVIKTYVPHYGTACRRISCARFSTSNFFRVYHKDGTLLESTEWVLDMHEDGILDHAAGARTAPSTPSTWATKAGPCPQCA